MKYSTESTVLCPMLRAVSIAASAAATRTSSRVLTVGVGDRVGMLRRSLLFRPAAAAGSARNLSSENALVKQQWRLSQGLGDLVGLSVANRPTVQKRLWEYIKSNNLQAPHDGRIINCNPALQAALGSQESTISMFDMMRLMSKQLTKI